jgi:HK97 family phage portal protein
MLNKFFGLATRKELQQQIEKAVKTTQAKYPQWLLETAGREQYNLPNPSVYANQADLYRRLSWVLAAVMHVASEAALTTFSVEKLEGEDSKEIKNHPFELRIRRPNDLDSRYEFLYGTVAMKKLTGNAYWWMNRTNENAEPDELWLIPSHMIKPLPDKQMYVKNFLYYPGNGMEIALEPWEVVHFRSFNPFSRFLGLSAIESLALTAQATFGMQKYSNKVYNESGGRPPAFILFAEMINDDQWDKIKTDTRKAAVEKDFMMLRGTGSGDVKLLQNAMSQKDMEFLGEMTANREEIFTVLAPGLSSMLDVSATEANALAGRATFRERAVYPELGAIAEKISNSILPAYGENLYGEFEDIRWSDKAQELLETTEYSKTHTIEEIRKKYYKDEPLGDERDDLIPSQLKPAGPFGAQSPPEQSAPVPPQLEKTIPTQETPTNELSPEQIKALVELDTWEEKSAKAGKLTRWHAVDLSEGIHAAVKKGEMTFEQARERVKGTRSETTAADVLEGIRLGVEALKAKA